MSDANTDQTLKALLALEADDSIAPDSTVKPSDMDQALPLPTLDQRSDMFLRAVYGLDRPITPEMRAAARDRLIGAMAADLADDGPAAGSGPVELPERPLQSDSNVAQFIPSPIAGLSQLWASFLKYGKSLTAPSELFTVRGLRMAAVPLVALLIAGTVWTTAWINQEGYSPADENTSPGEASPTARSRGLNTQADKSQAEQNLRRDIAAAEATFGPDHSVLVPKLVDLASLLYSEGRYAQAETLCTRALAIAQRTLGPRDPETVRAVKELAMIYRAQGRSREADELLTRVGEP